MFRCLSIRLACLLMAAAVLFCQSANSQTVTEVEKQPEDYDIQRGWALQFGIASDVTLTSFEGTALSIKRNFSEGSALRIGFSISGYSGASDVTHSFIETENAENNYTDINLGVALHLIRYLQANSRVKCFYGIGPRFEYSHNNEEIESSDNESELSSVIIGMSAVLGGEWFVAKNLSISAEYGATIAYQHNKETRTTGVSSPDPLVYEIDSDGFTMFPNDIKFGVSLYF